MKISTRGRYGLRLMVDLAMYSSNNKVTLKEISKRQDISDKYLEQIMTTLNRAGLVKSTRGASGGYSLARPATEITVGDIFRVVEGSVVIVECAQDPNYCDRMTACPTAFVWKKMRTAIEDIIDNITLQDLCDKGIEQAEFSFSI